MGSHLSVRAVWSASRWREIFDSVLDSELDNEDQWNLNFNYSLGETLTQEERRRGWKIHSSCTHAEYVWCVIFQKRPGRVCGICDWILCVMFKQVIVCTVCESSTACSIRSTVNNSTFDPQPPQNVIYISALCILGQSTLIVSCPDLAHHPLIKSPCCNIS